jgi:hypothetical protein
VNTNSAFTSYTLWEKIQPNHFPLQGKAPGLIPGEEFTTVAVKMLKVQDLAI